MNDLAYQDPDQHCLRLYDDARQCFFTGRNVRAKLVEEVCYDYGKELVLQYVIKHTIPNLQNPVPLTSDYIGPSATSICSKGECPDQSPFMLGTLEAKIYNIDTKDYDVARWDKLENVRYFYGFSGGMKENFKEVDMMCDVSWGL